MEFPLGGKVKEWLSLVLVKDSLSDSPETRLCRGDCAWGVTSERTLSSSPNSKKEK